MDWLQRLFSGWEIAAVGSTCQGRLLSVGTACWASLSTWRPRGVRCAVYHGCKTRPRRSRSSVRTHRRAGLKCLATCHLCPISPGASSPRSAFRAPSRIGARAHPKPCLGPFYSLVARATDRRAPTPPAPPSPSRARRPKPPVLDLQRRSAKPHPSRLDAGLSALHRRLRVRVRCRPPSPITPLFHAASRRRAEPPARLAEHRAGPCCDSLSRPGAIYAPHASAPVSTSSRRFHRHQASLPLSYFPRTTLLITVLSLGIPEPRRIKPWSGTPRECLHADGPPPAESAPLHPPQAPGRPRATPGLAAHCS
jgi:hypothetical protein